MCASQDSASLWKRELQRLADEDGAVERAWRQMGRCASKWNKIEHRLFAFITQNWRGKPFVSCRSLVFPDSVVRLGRIIPPSRSDTPWPARAAEVKEGVGPARRSAPCP